MKNIKSTEWLYANLNYEKLVVFDCRFSLKDPHLGRNSYMKSHIPGAYYCHLEEEMSGEKGTHGGRHPLPDIEQFRLFLEQSGVSNDTKVIAYDDGEGSFAARLWWLMKFFGHSDVYVLDGGFTEWERKDYPLEFITPSRLSATYELKLQPEILATYEDVKSKVESITSNVKLIDSREPNRYLGYEEPIDKVAGRIPGALNKYWLDGFYSGKYKPTEEQLKRFSNISKHEDIIVYCGSGVTAAPNFLILDELGYTNIKLYVGSFSDWISYEKSKIESN